MSMIQQHHDVWTDEKLRESFEKPSSDPVVRPPERYYTPQPMKRGTSLYITQAGLDYQPTPPPASVIVQPRVHAPNKDPCCLGCLLACFLCCAVKNE